MKRSLKTKIKPKDLKIAVLALLFLLITVTIVYMVGFLVGGEKVELSEPSSIPRKVIDFELPNDIAWRDDELGGLLVKQKWETIGQSPFIIMRPYEPRMEYTEPEGGNKKFLYTMGLGGNSGYWLQSGFDKLLSADDVREHLTPIESSEAAVAVVYFEYFTNFVMAEGSVPQGAVVKVGDTFYVHMIRNYICGKKKSFVYGISQDGVVTEMSFDANPPSLAESTC